MSNEIRTYNTVTSDPHRIQARAWSNHKRAIPEDHIFITRNLNNYVKENCKTNRYLPLVASLENVDFEHLEFKNKEKVALMAIFDGHNGNIASQFASEITPFELVMLKDYQEGNYERALRNLFPSIHNSLVNSKFYKCEPDKVQASGASISIALLTQDKTYFASLGNSPILICEKPLGSYRVKSSNELTNNNNSTRAIITNGNNYNSENSTRSNLSGLINKNVNHNADHNADYKHASKTGDKHGSSNTQRFRPLQEDESELIKKCKVIHYGGFHHSFNEQVIKQVEESKIPKFKIIHSETENSFCPGNNIKVYGAIGDGIYDKQVFNSLLREIHQFKLDNDFDELKGHGQRYLLQKFGEYLEQVKRDYTEFLLRILNFESPSKFLCDLLMAGRLCDITVDPIIRCPEITCLENKKMSGFLIASNGVIEGKLLAYPEPLYNVLLFDQTKGFDNCFKEFSLLSREPHTEDRSGILCWFVEKCNCLDCKINRDKVRRQEDGLSPRDYERYRREYERHERDQRKRQRQHQRQRRDNNNRKDDHKHQHKHHHDDNRKDNKADNPKDDTKSKHQLKQQSQHHRHHDDDKRNDKRQQETDDKRMLITNNPNLNGKKEECKRLKHYAQILTNQPHDVNRQRHVDTNDDTSDLSNDTSTSNSDSNSNNNSNSDSDDTSDDDVSRSSMRISNIHTVGYRK